MAMGILKLLLPVFGVLLLFYIGFCAMIYVNQSRYIYYPARGHDTTPRYHGYAYQDITYTTEDGASISAWYIPVPEARGTVLFCHGNAGNISHRMDTIEILNKLGLNVFLFDYRGYGKSKGTPTEKGTYKDAGGAWKYLVEELEINPEDIVIHGRSLGGAVAAYLAGKVNPKALVVESSFTSIVDMGKRTFPWFPAGLLVKYRYNSKKHIKKAKCPVLIIHSPDDEVVPYDMGETLYKLAPSPKRFLQLRGGHNDCFTLYEEKYKKTLEEFLFEKQ